MPTRYSTRGRKPSIAGAAARLAIVKRALRGLVTEIARLQRRLKGLNAFYSRAASSSRRLEPAAPARIGVPTCGT